MDSKVINGKVYINMSTLKTGEFLPYRAWTNIYVDSDGNLYNDRTLNGCNPRPAKYYPSNNSKESATVTRPVNLTHATDDKRTRLTIYKHIILDMLPNPYPEAKDVKPVKLETKPKPKPEPEPRLDDEQDKISLALLYPDEEFADSMYDGWQITHRMNIYHDGSHVKWSKSAADPNDLCITISRGIYLYKSDIEKRFNISQTERESDDEPETDLEEGPEPEPISLASLAGLEKFDEWFYNRSQDTILHGTIPIPWNVIDGEPVVELKQGDALEILTYDDLMDLIDY